MQFALSSILWNLYDPKSHMKTSYYIVAIQHFFFVEYKIYQVDVSICSNGLKF